MTSCDRCTGRTDRTCPSPEKHAVRPDAQQEFGAYLLACPHPCPTGEHGGAHYTAGDHHHDLFTPCTPNCPGGIP